MGLRLGLLNNSFGDKKVDQRWSVTLHGAMPGHFYGNPGLPKHQIPLSAFLILSRGKQSNMPGIRLAAGVAGKIAKLQSDRLLGSNPVFSFGVDSFSLFYLLGDHKAVVLFNP